MSVEESVREILAGLEGRRGNVADAGASVVAEGVARSGLTQRMTDVSSSIQTGVKEIGGGLANIATLLGVAASSISLEISRSTAYLAHVSNSLNAPRETAARERFRKGLTALRNGWIPEAIEELEESLQLDRFNAVAQSALGHALSANSQPREAGERYLLATRYASPVDKCFAAGCLLLAGAAFVEAGDTARAITELHQGVEGFPEFPEIALIHARISGDAELVGSALNVGPELVRMAVATGPDEVSNVVTALARDTDGPVHVARALLDIAFRFRRAFPGYDFPIDPDQFNNLGTQGAVEDIEDAAYLLARVDAISQSAASATPISPATSTHLHHSSAEFPELTTEYEARAAISEIEVQLRSAREERAAIAAASAQLAADLGSQDTILKQLAETEPEETYRELIGRHGLALSELRAQIAALVSDLDRQGVSVDPFHWGGTNKTALKATYANYRHLSSRARRLEAERVAASDALRAAALQHDADQARSLAKLTELHTERDLLLARQKEADLVVAAAEAALASARAKAAAALAAVEAIAVSQRAEKAELVLLLQDVRARIPARLRPWDGVLNA